MNLVRWQSESVQRDDGRSHLRVCDRDVAVFGGSARPVAFGRVRESRGERKQEQRDSETLEEQPGDIGDRRSQAESTGRRMRRSGYVGRRD